MKENMLVTQEIILRDKFNSRNFNADSEDNLSFQNYFKLKESNKFIFYFMQLLQFAFELNLLDESARNSIAEVLFTAVAKHANDNTTLITNYLYVISLYLKSLSNWDAWLALAKVTNQKNAENLLDTATQYFFNQLDEISEILASSKKIIFSLNEPLINNSFSSFEQSIKEVKKLVNVSLKDLHHSGVCIEYDFLRNIKFTNFLEYLRLAVPYFCIETSILSKTNSKSVIEGKHKEVYSVLKKKEANFMALTNSLGENLKNLKKEYHEKLQEAFDSQEKTEKLLFELEEKFALENPDLEENAFEEAFEDYVDTLDVNLFSSIDPTEVERWYQKEKRKLLSNAEKAEKLLERKEDKTDVLILDNYNLSFIIKEFALFSLANKQVIYYPDTAEKRSNALLMISLKESINEFLEHFSSSLSKDEIEYLTCARNEAN